MVEYYLCVESIAPDGKSNGKEYTRFDDIQDIVSSELTDTKVKEIVKEQTEKAYNDLKAIMRFEHPGTRLEVSAYETSGDENVLVTKEKRVF